MQIPSPPSCNIEIAFVPVAGTRILLSVLDEDPDPLGPATLEATQFITQAHAPPRRPKRSEGCDIQPSSPRKAGTHNHRRQLWK